MAVLPCGASAVLSRTKATGGAGSRFLGVGEGRAGSDRQTPPSANTRTLVTRVRRHTDARVLKPSFAVP